MAGKVRDSGEERRNYYFCFAKVYMLSNSLLTIDLYTLKDYYTTQPMLHKFVFQWLTVKTGQGAENE